MSDPFRLDLGQQRKRAKDFLKALRANDPAAVSRYRTHHPGGGGTAGPLLRLSEAQLVIARELGLPSWPRLKMHIATMRKARDSIARVGPAPDHDLPTLHIRCGSDIGPTLKQAGFVGDFLDYSDPLCQGPVVGAADWLDRRATFLAESYDDGRAASHDRIARGLADAEAALCVAATRYARVVLWFEHDPYDQLILARCLAQFARARPTRLELVLADRYPGGVRFIGLGQLPPEALRLLWDGRLAVSDACLQLGERVWSLLRAPDPRPLAVLARAGTPDLPSLGRALLRHCQELPWTTDGLGLTERLILQLVADEPRTAGEVFQHLMMQREPLPWLGDTMFWFIVRSMMKAGFPLLTSGRPDPDADWPKHVLAISVSGRQALAREVDYLSLHPPVRWLGGVRIDDIPPCYRWNPDVGVVELREC